MCHVCMDSKSTNLVCTFETMKRILIIAIVELLEAVREVVVDDDDRITYCGHTWAGGNSTIEFQNRIFASSDETTIRLLVHGSVE